MLTMKEILSKHKQETETETKTASLSEQVREFLSKIETQKKADAEEEGIPTTQPTSATPTDVDSGDATLDNMEKNPGDINYQASQQTMDLEFNPEVLQQYLSELAAILFNNNIPSEQKEAAIIEAAGIYALSRETEGFEKVANFAADLIASYKFASYCNDLIRNPMDIVTIKQAGLDESGPGTSYIVNYVDYLLGSTHTKQAGLEVNEPIAFSDLFGGF